MKKINHRYLSLFAFSVLKDFPLARFIDEKCYPIEDAYLRHFSYASRDNTLQNGNWVDQFLGALQPLASMANDVQQTFKPYKSNKSVLMDLAQPVRGVGNILRGFAHSIATPLLFLGYTIKYLFTSGSFSNFAKNMTLNLVYSSSWLIDGLSSFVRGASQIISTPLTWFLRIPLKSIITGVKHVREELILNFVDGTNLDLSYYMSPLNITIAIIVEFLEDHREITSLNLGYNNLRHADIQILAANTTLTSLNVERNDIGYAGAQVLAANTTLTSLNVEYNEIGNQGAQALATNTTLTSLNVMANNIGYVGAQALAANKTLTSLNVGSNQMGVAGAQALATNKTLTYLNVRWNHIGDAGAQALAANKTLTSLNVAFNDIGDAGAHAFITNHTLTSLDISDNLLEQQTLESIENTRPQILKPQAAWQQAAFLIGAERVTKSKGFPAGSADQLYTYELCEFLGPHSKLSGLDPEQFAQLKFFNNSNTRENSFEQMDIPQGQDIPQGSGLSFLP